MTYEELIKAFLEDMAAVKGSLGEYADALSDAKSEIESALDAAKEDLAIEEAEESV